ncbi:acyltransferase family protein [Halalkalibacter oceani]|uniref:acyltransferase family protein n=1 Tax=Halalkalibacter oceani TaxID=1653776 RepID=UPI003396CE8C
MGKQYLHEISFLRSIACLSIVLLHSIDWGMDYISFLAALPNYSKLVLDSVNMFLYYGTPTFIFITALILGFSYKGQKEIPENFLAKRVKFILIPYVCMGFLYAFPYLLVSSGEFAKKAFLNIFIGDFHAYFVLIIFQFYLFFVWGRSWLDRHPPLKVIGLSLILNVIYLSVFNFTDPVALPFADYIWERYYWIPFPGWIFYFTLAYYIGSHYETFSAMIKKYKVWVLIAPFVSGAVLLLSYHNGFTIDSSKRVDILFHTCSVIVFVLYFAMKMKTVPQLFIKISQYSYGIYLLHTMYMALLIILFDYTPLNFGIFTILVLFLVSTTFSMLTIFVLNKWKYGHYIVGRINVSTAKTKRREIKTSQAASIPSCNRTS